jgi:hypothetical protein
MSVQTRMFYPVPDIATARPFDLPLTFAAAPTQPNQRRPRIKPPFSTVTSMSFPITGQHHPKPAYRSLDNPDQRLHQPLILPEHTSPPDAVGHVSDLMQVDDPILDCTFQTAVLTWNAPNPPPRSYTKVKGVPEREGSAYILCCTIYASDEPPEPDVGQPSDIYIHRTDNHVWAKVEDREGDIVWTRWLSVLNHKIYHPLLPTYLLTSQRSLGIKWSTSNAIAIQRTRRHVPTSIFDSIDKTYITHPHLKLSQPPTNVVEPGAKMTRRDSVGVTHVETTQDATPPRRSTYLNPPTPPSPPPIPITHPEPDSLPDHPDLAELGMDVESNRLPSEPPMPKLTITLPPPRNRTLRSQTNPPLPPSRSPPHRLRNHPFSWLDRAGIEFPSYAKTVRWVSGVLTVLPWMLGSGGKPNPVRFLLLTHPSCFLNVF